jgi:hypothetical protein
VKYKVALDDAGGVSIVIGRAVPAHDQPIPLETPKPAPAPSKKRRWLACRLHSCPGSEIALAALAVLRKMQ